MSTGQVAVAGRCRCITQTTIVTGKRVLCRGMAGVVRGPAAGVIGALRVTTYLTAGTPRYGWL